MKLKIMTTGVLLLWLLIACAAPVEVEVAEENTVASSVEESEVATTTEPPPTSQAADDATALPATALPAATKASLAASLPRISKAPDITNETWLNSEPMTLAGQEGKVVLVEFWTYT